MSKLVLPFYIITTTLALVMLKLGTKDGTPLSIENNKIHFNVNPYSMAGILLYGVSFLLYIYLISKNDLGYIIPVTAAFVYIIVFVASYFIFHEVFTVLKVTGIALIILGLVFLNYSR